MENLVNLPNISADTLASLDFDSKKSTTAFNVKNYLNVRLAPTESFKELHIRLLPMNLEDGNPFAHVHVHNMNGLNEDISKSGFKSFICLNKNPDINHEKFGNKCPFCELNASAYQSAQEELDAAKAAEEKINAEISKGSNADKQVIEKLQREKEQHQQLAENYKKVSVANYATSAVIVRCIERGNEADGVKFWKFNLSKRQDDPYHLIMGLYNSAKKEGEEHGEDVNILDIYNGKDLIVKITKNRENQRDQKTTITISTSNYPSPLSTSEEEMRKWIYDEKKWYDVFTAKPYEYLKLASENRSPWFDRNEGKWVEKQAYQENQSDAENKAKSEINRAEQKLAEVSTGYPSAMPTPTVGNYPKPEQASSGLNTGSQFVDSLNADIQVPDDDDIPF